MKAIVGFLLGILVTLAVFGATLALSWAIVGDGRLAKLVATLASATVAFIVGGYTAAVLARHRHILLSTAFGCIFGAACSIYILGPVPIAAGLAVCSAVAATVGGLVNRLPGRRTPLLGGFNAG